MSRLFVFFITIFCAELHAEGILFTKEESKYLSENRIITIGSGETFEPFIFKDSKGNTTGFDRELANIIQAKTGLKIKFELDNWHDIQIKAKNGLLNGLSSVTYTQEREKDFVFSVPYMTYMPIVIVKKDSPSNITEVKHTEYKKAAVQRSNAVFDSMTKSLPHVDIHYYDGLYDVLYAVANGNVDFAVLDESIYYLVDKLGLSSLLSTSFVIGDKIPLRLAFSKNDDILLSIVNKVILDIPDRKLREMKQRWFKVNNKMKLTVDEKNYIQNLKQIRVCINPNRYPLEKNDNNKMVGMASDYVDIISNKLNIPIIYESTDTWSESVIKFQSGECDILPMINNNFSISKTNYSNVYEYLPLVIVTKLTEDFIFSENNLKGMKVAVVEDTGYKPFVEKIMQEQLVLTVKNTKEGLEKVDIGEIDAFVEALPIVNYYLKSKLFTELKISGKLDEFVGVSFAVKSLDGLLLNIINKILNDINKDDKYLIFNKYSPVEYRDVIDYKILIKLSLFFTFIVLLQIFWNKKLSVEKKKVEQALMDRNNTIKKGINFIEMISHEYRTPLAIIKSSIDLIDKISAQDKYKKISRPLNNIEIANKRLYSIFELTLKNERLDSHHIVLNKEYFDFFTMLEKVVHFNSHIFPEFRVEICDKVKSEVELYADEDLIYTMLLNVINNACKNSLENKNIKIEVELKNGFLKINIIDFGVGIEEEEINNIFVKYKKVGDISKQKGLGLGLYLVKEISILHGLQIKVNSKINTGTNFEIVFPDCNMVTVL